jgi:hypothetical protein
MIGTKSGGVSRARDLAHSRPRLDKEKHSENVLEQFSLRLQKNIKSMAHLDTKSALAAPFAGAARSMPLRNLAWAYFFMEQPAYFSEARKSFHAALLNSILRIDATGMLVTTAAPSSGP